MHGFMKCIVTFLKPALNASDTVENFVKTFKRII